MVENVLMFTVRLFKRVGGLKCDAETLFERTVRARGKDMRSRRLALEGGGMESQEESCR